MDNVPTPLADAPISLLRGEDWQMSFAERAALEGILSQLRPRVAVEVGSAAGGSLRRLARHSARVHSFDLTLPADDVAGLPNVVVHVGDSRFTLPTWLATAKAIDFALVDGDHTPEGVHADLSALLESRAAARTLILLHDVEHLGVREGIEAALEPPGPVVYSDLNFLPGYTFARGGWADQRWGGFALVLTGETDTPQTQDLYRSDHP
jgi:hypothetical protein